MIPTPDAVHRASEILEQIERLQSELVSLFSGAPARRGGARPKSAGQRRMSPEARARIANAARARWAKYRAAKKGAAPAAK